MISFGEILDLLDGDMSFIFNICVSRFEKSFSLEKLVEFKELLSKLVSGKYASTDDFRKLLQMRRHAQRLRAAYFMFDISHSIPRDLNKLVVKLGKLKDAVIAKAKVEEQARKTNKFIDKLLGDNLEHIIKLDFKKDFISTSTVELHAFLKSRLEQAIDVIEKGGEAQVRLTYSDYHSLRKTIRNFYWLIQFVRNEFEIKGLLELKDRLKETNRSMGSVCDKIEQERLRTGEKHQGMIDVTGSVLKTLGLLVRMLAGENIKSLVNTR